MNDPPPTNGTIRGFAMNGVDERSICYSLIERSRFYFKFRRNIRFILTRDTIEESSKGGLFDYFARKFDP